MQPVGGRGALLLTVSQSSCITRPCPTISFGLMGTSWSAALVVGVTTFASNLCSSHRFSLPKPLRPDTVLFGCAPLLRASHVESVKQGSRNSLLEAQVHSTAS